MNYAHEGVDWLDEPPTWGELQRQAVEAGNNLARMRGIESRLRYAIERLETLGGDPKEVAFLRAILGEPT